MKRCVLMLAALVGCASTEDPRPLELSYVVNTILKPACTGVVCHSALGRGEGYIFDSVDAARTSLSKLVVPGSPESSYLLSVMRGQAGEPMPPTGVIADRDLALLEAWILAGAEGL